MKMTLSTSQAASLLAADNNNGFTYSGATALIEYLEELEAGTGEEIELDPVAIRGDFTEYENLHAWARDYFVGDFRDSIDWDRETEASELKRADILEVNGNISDASAVRRYLKEDLDSVIRRYITDHGQLIEFDGGVIVSAF